MSKRDDERIILSKLFVAVPELSVDFDFLEALRETRTITTEEFRKYRASQAFAGRLNRKMRNQSLLGRIGAVAPELFSVQAVNLLRQYGLIDVQSARALRLVIRGTGVVGKFDRLNSYERIARLLELGISHEMVNLAEAQGRLTKQEARYLRGYITGGRHIQESLPDLLRAKSWASRLLLFADTLVDAEFVNALVRVGLITPQVAANFNGFIALSKKEWRVFSSARAGEGFRQRMILMLTGSLNDEFVDLLFTTSIGGKKIPAQYRPFFQIAIEQSRKINDHMLESLVKRRYRVLPGEKPLVTFRRASRKTDEEILEILAQAARDAGKLAATLDTSKAGGAARAAQLRATRASLHLKMHEVWHGVGALTIFGEKEAAEAAAESVDALTGRFLTKEFGQSGRNAILFQSKAGVDAYISRQENLVQLSSRIYKNLALYDGRIDRQIDLAILQGKSAAEFAKDVERFFKPNVPGGTHYAAMRLARTEINNAFHLFTIRSTREQPWIQGYQWLLSGSHPNSKADVCNDYAEQDGYDMGIGVFPKASVPGKPHPNCLCTIIAKVMDEKTFATAMNKGRFDQYLTLMRRNNAAAAGIDDDSTFAGASLKYAGVRTAKRVLPNAFTTSASKAMNRTL